MNFRLDENKNLLLWSQEDQVLQDGFCLISTVNPEVSGYNLNHRLTIKTKWPL